MKSASSVSRVEALLQDLKQSFVDELPRRLEDMENLLLSLKHDADPMPQLHDLFRRIHSLKGSAGTYGFHLITSICHGLEERFHVGVNTSGGFSETQINALLPYFDLIREVIRSPGTQTNLTVETELQLLNQSLAANTIRLLLLTSSRTIRNVCKSVFSGASITWLDLDDGYLALGRLLAEKFDAVITSNQLNHMNGTALTAALRLTPGPNQQTPIILLTSSYEPVHSPRLEPDYIGIRDKDFIENLYKIKQDLDIKGLRTQDGKRKG